MRLRAVAVVGLFAVAGSTAIWACYASMGASVHFNTYRPDFRLPPSSVIVLGEEDSRPTKDNPGFQGVVWPNWEETERKHNRLAEYVAGQLARATKAWKAGRFDEAARCYTDARRVAAQDDDAYGDINPLPASSMKDRLAILRSTWSSAERPWVGNYLMARDWYDAGQRSKAIRLMTGIIAEPSSGGLANEAKFFLAGASFDTLDDGAMTTRVPFRAVAKDYLAYAAAPRVLRPEVARLMAAQALLMDNSGDWRQGDQVADPPATVQDAQEALQVLAPLLKHPSSPYYSRAVGWRARALLLEGNVADALLVYLAQYAAAPADASKVSYLVSISRASRSMSSAQAARLNKLLITRPELLESYLDYRIDHVEEVKSLASLPRFAELCLTSAKRGTRLSADICGRLAEIEYRLGKFSKALQWARRGSARSDLARYMEGSVLAKQKKPLAAIAAYERLVKFGTSPSLVAGGRENLAILYEQRGKFADAIDQYYRLGYETDLAYVADAQISTGELERYVARLKHGDFRDRLTYALAMRYIRIGDLDRAASTLRGVPNSKRRKLAGVSDAKDVDLGFDRDSKLYDPIETIRYLRSLQEKVAAAKEGNAKASAMYRLACGFYDRRDLMLYSLPLWEGNRAFMFSLCWEPTSVTSKEEKVLESYMFEHECMGQAQKICLEVARRYPNSPTAPAALYKAGVSMEHLANFNGWWRDYDHNHRLTLQASQTMDRLAKRYPKSPFAAKARKFARVWKATAAEIAKDPYYPN